MLISYEFFNHSFARFDLLCENAFDINIFIHAGSLKNMGVEWIMLSGKWRCIADEIESGNVTSYIPKRFFSDVQAYVVICIDNGTETRRGGVFPSKCAIETNAT